MKLIAACFSLMLSHALGLPTWNSSHGSSPDHEVLPIHPFPLGTWVENLLVRQNGHILATIYTPLPEVYQIVPQSKQTTLVATIPNNRNALGIAEGPKSNIIYVIGEDFPVSTLRGVKGSNAIYEIDLDNFDISNGRRKAAVNLALRVPNATALNGIAPVNAAEGLYVSTDFDGGSIYLLNLVTGDAKVIVSNEWTKRLTGAAGGADGIKVHEGHIYWTTFSANVFARIPINEAGMPSGAAEKLADVFSDDFCFGPRGEAYLTLPAENAIGVWEPDSKEVQKLPGEIFGPTAVQLGAGGDRLIITTSGNDTQYPDHVTRPGAVVSLDLRSHSW